MGGGGEGRGFSYLLESHMTYLAGSHVHRSWPGIRLKRVIFLEEFFFFVKEFFLFHNSLTFFKETVSPDSNSLEVI